MQSHIGWRDHISRGAQASAETRKNNLMCRKGLHEMTPENTKMNKKKGRADYRTCIACAKIAYNSRRMGPREEPWR